MRTIILCSMKNSPAMTTISSISRYPNSPLSISNGDCSTLNSVSTLFSVFSCLLLERRFLAVAPCFIGLKFILQSVYMLSMIKHNEWRSSPLSIIFYIPGRRIWTRLYIMSLSIRDRLNTLISFLLPNLATFLCQHYKSVSRHASPRTQANIFNCFVLKYCLLPCAVQIF